MAGASMFSEQLADQICSQIAQGKSLRQIAKLPEMPAPSTICFWIQRPDLAPGFAERYARAKEAQAELMAEDIVAIADDSSEDIETRYNEKGEPYELVDHDHINRSRLRVDSRKWLLSKLLPKKYGDAQLIKHADADGNALKIEVTRIADTPRQLSAPSKVIDVQKEETDGSEGL